MLAAAALLVAVVSLLIPRATLALLLFALPFATHHPVSVPTVLLIVLTATFEVAYALRTRPSWAGVRRAVTTQPLLALAALFAAAACLSLSALPLASIAEEYRAILGPSPGARRLFALVLDWLLLTEARREFPITAALLTVQGLVLALIVAREAAASSRMAARMTAAVAIGLVVFVVLGLLEPFGVSLALLRGDTVNPVAVRPGTVQSVAGNPGWFSQYVVYALPFGLIVLMGESRPLLRAAALTLISGIASFGLLVSFQRGGWMAGLLVLGYTMAAGWSLMRQDHPPSGRRRRLPWRAVSAALVFVLVVVAGFLVWTRTAAPDSSGFGAAAYLARLKSIGPGERLPYARAGIRIAALHPVLGGGHESFAYRYRVYFDRPGGPYQHSGIRVPDPASAHSVYMQTWTGTGTVGLVLLLALFVAAAVTLWRSRHAAVVSGARRVALLSAAGSLLGMAFYGLVQEIFYVHALRLMFFVAIGLVAGSAGDAIRWPPRVTRAAWILLALAFAAHLVYEEVWPGPQRLFVPNEPAGLYAEQPGADGIPVRWTSEFGAWPVPEGARHFALRLKSLTAYPQEVEVRACGRGVIRQPLTDHQWHTLEGPLEGCGPGARLRLSVTPTWSPRTDVHTLGVLTAEMRFE